MHSLNLKTLAAAAILLTAVSVFAVIRTGPAAAAESSPQNGVAVVELFTSQGCSSCPPAERVLGELNAAAARDGRAVLTLAFHVDYWDNLGWKDRFGDAAHSARQRRYARTLKTDSVYTPQMIVNGRTEFVGSDRRKAEAAVDAALGQTPAVPVTALQVARDGDAYRVHYAAPAAGDGLVVNVAVVEQGLSTKVQRGENAGRTIREPSVVRWFKSVPAEKAADVRVEPPADVKAADASVVVYVQRSADAAVLGAAATPLK